LLLNLIALIAGGLVYIPTFYTLIFARFVQGFCVGAYSSIAPLIIKELAPTEISGTLGSYAQLMVTIGVFFGCIFKYILYKVTGDETGKEYWYITFGVTEITVAIQTIVLVFVFPY
jgi:MFS family permease